jgi:hypothetical protein
MSYQLFREICMGVHAIKDYARRVPNKAVGLPDTGGRYTIPDKVAALSKRIWNDRSSHGGRFFNTSSMADRTNNSPNACGKRSMIRNGRSMDSASARLARSSGGRCRRGFHLATDAHRKH